MRVSAARAGVFGFLLASPAALAVDIVYVTDLEIYTLLAPCATDALSWNIGAQRMSSRCGTDFEDLQSCVCSSTAVFSEVESGLRRDVSSSCGNAATADQSSASQVLEQYCNPDSTIIFPTPTTNIVRAYITELSEMEYLPRCAQSALSEAVMGAVNYCPWDASVYAPCVCTKDIVTSRVSDVLTRSGRYSCSNNEDITAARDFYHEYCAMNDGTTSFKSPSGPPGDMTYYVTALPQYKSLDDCAQSAVSTALNAQTAWMCASGPQALASCACLKSGMRSRVSSTLTSQVKWHCENTATAQVTSALDVLDVYCSAAADDVSFSVSESVSESFAVTETGAEPSGPSSTGGSGGGSSEGGNGDESQNEGDDENGSGGDSENQSGGDGGGGGTNQTAVIAASVLGGVLAIALVVGGVWFWKRRKNKKNGQPLGPTVGNENPPGTPELAGGYSSSPGPGYGSKELSPQLTSVSPAWGRGAELPAGAQSSPASELPSQQQIPRELAASANGQEQHAWAQYQQQQQSSVSPLTPPNNEQMGWQAGPVQSYELESSTRR